MAKKKRLNKNLVALLTIVGMVTVVATVALFLYQGTRRDPAILATNAKALEDQYRESGKIRDLADAAKLYLQAYDASDKREPEYLLDLARCQYMMGDLPGWLETLRTVHFERPNDPTYPVAVLEGLWRAKEIAGDVVYPRDWWIWGTRLLSYEYNDDPIELTADQKVLGAVCRVQGGRRWTEYDPDLDFETLGLDGARAAQVGADYGMTVEDMMQKIYERAPTDPRVALTYRDVRFDDVYSQILAARTVGESDAQIRQRFRAMYDELDPVLRAAVQAHPDDPMLVVTWAGTLSSRERREALGADEAAERDEARAVLERALAARPDDPELSLAMARQLATEHDAQRATLSAAEGRAICLEAAEFARRAIDLEPAMYAAYELLARLQLVTPPPDGEKGDAAAAMAAALAVYDEARTNTLILKNTRATLTQVARWVLMWRGEVVALEAHRLAVTQEDTAAQQARLDQARTFYEDVRTNQPDWPLTHYMEGSLAIAENELDAAILAFEAANNPDWSARRWLDVARVPALPSEKLAGLYERRGEIGAALQHAEAAIGAYESQLRRVPPVHLVLTLASQYRRQPESADSARRSGDERALDLLDRYSLVYQGVDRQRIQAARAETLAGLGRGAEAAQAVAEVTGDQAEAPAWLWLRLAVNEGDAEATVARARSVLSAPDANLRQRHSALQYLMQSLEKLDDEDPLAEVQRLQADAAGEGLERLLRAYAIVYSEPDPAARNEKLLAMIAENPDEFDRAEQLANFWTSTGDAEKVLEHVRIMRRLRPDDINAVEREFRALLALRQSDEAEALIPLLSAANNGKGQDLAGGSTYRGRVALGRRDGENAIREFRAAVHLLPKSAALQTDLARAYIAAGRTNEAMEALQTAIAINPRYVDAYGLLINRLEELAEKSYGAESEQYREQATANFDTLAALVPNHPFVKMRLEEQREEQDPVAAIAVKRQKLADAMAADPQSWAESAGNLADVVRLTKLYSLAWSEAEERSDTAEQGRIAAEAEQMYAQLTQRTTGNVRLALAQAAAGFFALTGDLETGEAFFRSLRDGLTGGERVIAQLLLASLLERIGRQREDDDLMNAAEQAYQRAQRLTGADTIADATRRRDASLRVGMALTEFYERGGRPERVVEVCRWLLGQMDDESAGAQRVRGQLMDALLDAAQLDEAQREIELYIELYGEDLKAWNARARLAIGRRQRGAALQDLEKILRHDPDDPWALVARGWLYFGQSRNDQARASLLAARKVMPPGSPWMARLLVLLSKVNEATGNLDEAIGAYETLLSNLVEQGETRSQTLRIEQVVAELIRLLRKADRLDRAQQLISEYIERRPNDPGWPYRLGELLSLRAELAKKRGDAVEAQREFVAAADYHKRAVELAQVRIAKSSGGGSNNIDTLWMVRAIAAHMDALTDAGRPGEAIGYFRSIPLAAPRPDIRVAAARAFWTMRNVDEAYAQWQRALQEAAGANVGSVIMVAQSVAETLDPDQTEELLSRVVQRVPPTSVQGGRLRLALARQMAARLELDPNRANPARVQAALDALTEVLSRLAGNSPERRLALGAQARLQEIAGRVDLAIRSYEALLEQTPDDQVALNNLAFLLVTAEDPALLRPQAALEYAKRLEATTEDFDSPANILDTIGWVTYRYAELAGTEYTLSPERRLSLLEHAAALLEQSINARAENNASAYLHLGQVYRALGRHTDARALLERGRQRSAEAGNQEELKQFDELLDAQP